jgi:hypothetical protein
LIGGHAADSGARADQSGLEMMLSRLSEVELEHCLRAERQVIVRYLTVNSLIASSNAILLLNST